jgi:uncharacterized protein (DUF433 family)
LKELKNPYPAKKKAAIIVKDPAILGGTPVFPGTWSAQTL